MAGSAADLQFELSLACLRLKSSNDCCFAVIDAHAVQHVLPQGSGAQTLRRHVGAGISISMHDTPPEAVDAVHSGIIFGSQDKSDRVSDYRYLKHMLDPTQVLACSFTVCC